MWPSDAMWWHRFGATLAQIMACCLMAPSHYLFLCWVIIKGVLAFTWEQFYENLICKLCSKITFWNYLYITQGQWVNQVFKEYTLKLLLSSPSSQWVNRVQKLSVAEDFFSSYFHASYLSHTMYYAVQSINHPPPLSAGIHQWEIHTGGYSINSSAPGRCDSNPKWAIFKFTSRIDILSVFCVIALDD